MPITKRLRAKGPEQKARRASPQRPAYPLTEHGWYGVSDLHRTTPATEAQVSAALDAGALPFVRGKRRQRLVEGRHLIRWLKGLLEGGR